jgi:glycine C-acetyltransferase
VTLDREQARALNLADFYQGHDDDPLLAPADFMAWRGATAREQSIFRRPLASASGPRTRFRFGSEIREVVNLASLDYLGLNGEPRVVAAAKAALDRWGTGACGVPLLSGTTELHEELETAMSEMLHRESTMLFPSGFSGGFGLMSGLLRRGDVAIADEKAHMCWLDGVRSSGAQLVLYRHEDTRSLDEALAKHSKARRIVIVDGLYSMDGDVANLPAILDVCEAHDVGLVVDEAHSIFALGEGGGGASDQHGVLDRVRLLFGTFSKSIASLGGFASGSRGLLDYARLYAHPFGFSAALPPAVVAANLEAVRIARAEPERRRRLAENAAYFRNALHGIGLDTGQSTTHVVPILVGDERGLLYDAALEMLERGLYVIPIDYPAVPEGAVRFRTSLSANHTRSDLDRALQILADSVAKPLRARGKLTR